MIILAITLLFNQLESPPDINNKYGFSINCSIEALKATPRYTIEPIAGGQIFQRTEATCFYQTNLFKEVYLGVKSGVGGILHYTYYYSYFNAGLLDSYFWTSVNTAKNINGFLVLTMPSGNYTKSLGGGAGGAYEVKVGLQKANVYKNSKISIGYVWRGTNQDLVNYGDKLFCELENHNLNLSFNFCFPDKSGLFDLHDSKSFSISILIPLKTFNSLGAFIPKLFFGQTIYGRDTNIITNTKAEFIGNK
jgi:hypothetical protein